MKGTGTLNKTKEGWVVKYTTESEGDLPIVFIDQKHIVLDDSHIGREVHFEKVKIKMTESEYEGIYARILGIALEKESWDSIAEDYKNPRNYFKYAVFEYLEKYYNVPTKK